MARLIYVPVVHSVAEMGSAAPAYVDAFIARYGRDKWAERAADFDAIWRVIGDALSELELDWKHVKLYQDSLPVCGREQDLVDDLADNGSQNHQLLKRLIQNGAMIVGTESPTLLVEEYELLRSPGHHEAKAAALLEARDRFIAQKIDSTLNENEVGILFIGALHKVAKFLPSRIKVEILTPKNHR